ncbi:unnamed protein product [Closterium sp. NIES-53]
MAATASRGSSPFSRFGDSQSFNFDALKNFSALTPSIQSHLQKVYLTLSLTLVVASLGAYAHVLWGLGGALSSIASIAGVLWLNATPAVPANEVRLLSASSSPRLPVSSFATKRRRFFFHFSATPFFVFPSFNTFSPFFPVSPFPRVAGSSRIIRQPFRFRLLLAIAFSHGCSIGPLVDAVIQINPGLLVTAFVATAAIFLCFSGAALLAKRREYLYLGGFLASAVSTMLALRLASIFFGGSNAVFQIELYGGLLVFSGYIIYDTQVLLERARQGQCDHVVDALELLLDFVAVFVRILFILVSL